MYPRYLVKAALEQSGIALEKALAAAQEAETSAENKTRHLEGIQDLSESANVNPIITALKSGIPLSALGAIPGALLGGRVGAGLGATAGGILGGWVGAGRPEEALKRLVEVRKGAPVAGRSVTPRMRKVVRGLITEN